MGSVEAWSSARVPLLVDKKKDSIRFDEVTPNRIAFEVDSPCRAGNCQLHYAHLEVPALASLVVKGVGDSECLLRIEHDMDGSIRPIHRGVPFRKCLPSRFPSQWPVIHLGFGWMHREDRRSRAISSRKGRKLIVDGDPGVRGVTYHERALRGAPDGYRSEDDQVSAE